MAVVFGVIVFVAAVWIATVPSPRVFPLPIAEVGEEVLANFIEGAVVRLVLSPEGIFTAYTLEGGDLVSFKLGEQSIELRGEGEWEDPWVSHG